MNALKDPVLWHFAISHYGEKVRWALDYKAIEHTKVLRFIDYPIRNLLRTGQIQTPILFHEELTLTDSSNIIDYLENHFPQRPLYPKNKDELEQALALSRYFDNELGPNIRAVLVSKMFEKGRDVSVESFGMGSSQWQKQILKIIFPRFISFYRLRHKINPKKLDVAKGKVQEAINLFEKEIADKDFLVGNQFSVADLTAASLFYPLVLPDEYPYTMPEKAFEGLIEIQGDFKVNRLYEWVSEVYKQHRLPIQMKNEGKSKVEIPVIY